MDTLLWILLVGLYVALWFFLGLATLRKGHKLLFWLGIFFPLLWIIGAFMSPKHEAGLAGRA